MVNWFSTLDSFLLVFLMNCEVKNTPKKSVNILIFTGGLLLLTVIFAWFFQEQLSESFLSIAILAFFVFVLVVRSIYGLINLRYKT